MLTRVRQNQHASFGTCLFDGRAHDHVDELFQDDFSRHGLRDLYHGGQIEVFDRCDHRRCRAKRLLFGPQQRIPRLELPHLAVSAPTQVAVASVLQVNTGYFSKTSGRVEARRQFVGKGFDMDKAALLRRVDGLFVKQLSLDHAPFDAGDLGVDQRGPAREILWALFSPDLELPVIRRHCDQVLRTLVRRDTVAPSGTSQRVIEVKLSLLEEQIGRP